MVIMPNDTNVINLISQMMHWSGGGAKNVFLVVKKSRLCAGDLLLSRALDL